ncbi:MAG: HDOD domain-containing protein, partial [Deltaproteobacteria bacterium]|nr:HDOD domain-containing protein [Deltaproteobacteria bacterium]
MTDERRLLMVGGDERLLARLRNLLRDEWELHQARTGEEALSWLKDHGAALVLAEGRLPGLDTASFLSRVRDDHPAAARLAFWPAGSAGTLPAIHSAQRTMRSTDSDESVLEAVQRTTVLQRLVSDEGVRRVVGRLDRLPSVPRTYWALVQAAGQPEKGMSEFAQIIESDPAMSVKVLQLVNSAFFGVSRRVTSIQQAVA